MPSKSLHPTTIIFLLLLAAPLSGQWYNLQNGTFESQFEMDTNQNERFDTYGAPASWASEEGILFGRDYAPNAIVEGLVKLIDNRRANGHWTYGFASVTPRLVRVELANRDTRDRWVIVAGKGTSRYTLWVAVPNGVSRYAKCGFGSSVSILHAFDGQGLIPREHFRTHYTEILRVPCSSSSAGPEVEKLIELSHKTPPVN